jgi:hypothetical protein
MIHSGLLAPTWGLFFCLNFAILDNYPKSLYNVVTLEVKEGEKINQYVLPFKRELRPGKRIFRDSFKRDGKRVTTKTIVVTRPSRLDRKAV